MNTLDDFVSVLIAIIAVVYTFVTIMRAIYTANKEMPEEQEEEEEEFVEVIQEKPKPLPKVQETYRPLHEEYSFHSSFDDYQTESAITDRELTIHLRPKGQLVSEDFRLEDTEGVVVKMRQKQSVRKLIKSLPEEKLLFLSYEVFHVPVSKRPSIFPWNH